MPRPRLTLLTLASAVVFALAACGDTVDPPVTPTPTTTTSSTPDPVVHDLEINETVRWNQWSFSFSAVETSKLCEHSQSIAPEGEVLLTVTGTVESDSDGHDPAGTPFPGPLKAETDDGHVIEVRNAAACASPSEERPGWEAPANDNAPTEFHSVFLAPENTTHLIVTADHQTWRTAVSTRAPETKPSEAIVPPIPSESAPPTVVDCLRDGPRFFGPALMSDGSHRPDPYCQHLADNPSDDVYWCDSIQMFTGVPDECPGARTAPESTPETVVPEEPSPWVQGQIDWSNCLAEGNTEQQCREMLEG